MPEKVKDPDSAEASSEPTHSAPEPIRIVRRSIECPDGSTVEVDVPVYPPYRFEVRDLKPSAPKSLGRESTAAKGLSRGSRPEATKRARKASAKGGRKSSASE